MEQKLLFYLSRSHACSYLENRDSQSLFADPAFPQSKSLYSALVANGFRRSGEHVYRPHCAECNECKPVRIPVEDFNLNKNQRRVLKKNKDIRISIAEQKFREDHFVLYEKYLAHRHKNGGMDNPSRESYEDFLWADWSETLLYEFYHENTLICVAVVDVLINAMSAVYTFFDPDYAALSPGKYAILQLIEECKLKKLGFLYLGYWIAECDKMKYKNEYQPLEYFVNDEWVPFGSF